MASNAARTAGILDEYGRIDTKQTKSFSLADGTPCSARVVGLRHDRLSGGGVAGLTFQFCSPMTARGVVDGREADEGWEASSLRAWLSGEGLGLLPAELADLILSVEKASASSGGKISMLVEDLWLMSEVELAGGTYITERYADPAPVLAEGEPYQLFLEAAADPAAFDAAMIKPDGDTGAWSCWWERTLDSEGTGFLFRSYAGGHAAPIQYDPNFELGVVPGFCL